jgi:hypothetical protein
VKQYEYRKSFGSVTNRRKAVIHKYDDKPDHAKALTIKIKIAKVIQGHQRLKEEQQFSPP